MLRSFAERPISICESGIFCDIKHALFAFLCLWRFLVLQQAQDWHLLSPIRWFLPGRTSRWRRRPLPSPQRQLLEIQRCKLWPSWHQRCLKALISYIQSHFCRPSQSIQRNIPGHAQISFDMPRCSLICLDRIIMTPRVSDYIHPSYMPYYTICF